MASKASRLFGLEILALASSALAQEITISETDDTQDVITSALTDASAEDGDVLVFPEGTYNFSGQVSTNLNLALRGALPAGGPPATILRKTTNARFFEFFGNCGGSESGIKNLQFIDESGFMVSGPGGAISVGESLLEGIERSIFSGNHSDDNGGAVSMPSFTESIKDSIFFGNYAGIDGKGGAVFVDIFSGNIENSTFSENYANAGGAVFISSLTGNMESLTFFGNHSGGPGGTVYASSFSGKIVNSSFFKNYGGYDGAVLSNNFYGAIRDSIFFENRAGRDGGAVIVGNIGGSGTESFCDLGGSKFLSNSAIWNGGAIHIYYNGYCCALNDDAIFQGNKDTGGELPNAIFCVNSGNDKNIGVAAAADKTFYLYDPIRSDSSKKGLTIKINPESDHGGTVLLDQYRSDVYYESPSGATVHHGTLALHNGASFGASDNNGTFTLQSDATLRVAYGQETRVFDCEIGESGSYTVSESTYIPTYDSTSTVSKIVAGKVNLNGRVDFFLPENVKQGNFMLTTPGLVEFKSATFSVGMLECPEEIDVGDSVALIHSEQEIANYTDYTQEPSSLRGEFSAFGYYFELSTPSPYELCATLCWADPTSTESYAESTIWSESYYGESSESMSESFPESMPESFTESMPESTLWSESYYSESMPESMTESLPESANLTESDFGSESGLNVESEVVPESVVAPEVEPPAAQPEGYPTGIILLNHCGNLIGDFGETVLTKPFNLYGVLHCGVERHRISFPLEVGFRSLLVGFNFCGDTAHGRWSGGAFLESGSATCHRRHGAGEDFRGESNCNCLGGGLLICGLLKFNDRNHVLLEVSGRTGRIENRWDNLTNSGDLRRKDDRTSSYGSTHCGVAYRLGGNKLLLDFFGKYFWTELAGKSFALKNESGTKLQNVHANRLRIGGKISLPSARRLCPYGSVAWERKFNTGGRESPHGAAIEQLSLEGSSYFGEIGLSCKFAAKQPLTVDVGIRGHVGTGHSVNGTIRALLEF